MGLIKEFVVTLITTLIFISAVEIIVPDNSMKKYLKFALGLILTAVILNPILSILVSGEESITESISRLTESNIQIKEEKAEVSNEYSKKSFEQNLNRNLENMLKDEFSEYEFTCETKCEANFENFEYKINEVNVYILKDGIKKIDKIQKVDIDKESNEKEENDNKRYKDITKFLKNKLQIEEEIINVYDQEKEGN